MSKQACGRAVDCPICHIAYFIEGVANRDRICYRKGAWKLLCICGHQIVFNKQSLLWCAASAMSFQRGYAPYTEWETSQPFNELYHSIFSKGYVFSRI
jgi:hypothetical protein